MNFSLAWFVSPSLIQLHPGRPACFSFCSWSQPPSPVSSASPWRWWRWRCPVLRNFGLVYCPLGFSLNVKVLECLLEGQLEMMLFHTQEVLFCFMDLQVKATRTFSGFPSAESTHIQESTHRELRGLR